MRGIEFCKVLETEGYVLNNDGKLAKVKLTKQIYRNDCDLRLYYGEGENDWVHPSDFYASVSNYKDVRPVSTYGDNTDNYRIPRTVYMIENGRVKEHNLCDITGRLNENNEWVFTADIEGEYYLSPDVARAMADVVVIEDGKEEIRQGVLKRAMLTDAQRKAVNALEKAYKKAQELGVSILFNGYEDQLYAINTLNQGYQLAECDADTDLVNPRFLPIAEREVRSQFKLDLILPRFTDDYGIYVEE